MAETNSTGFGGVIAGFAHQRSIELLIDSVNVLTRCLFMET
jgi:hypothetical protein